MALAPVGSEQNKPKAKVVSPMTIHYPVHSPDSLRFQERSQTRMNCHCTCIRMQHLMHTLPLVYYPTRRLHNPCLLPWGLGLWLARVACRLRLRLK